MLEQRDLDSVDGTVETLFETAFSDIEKVPIENINRALGRGAVLTTYSDDGVFIGFTISYIEEGRIFLVYIATESKMRGKGYGGQILHLIRERYPKHRIFLVLEPQDQSASDYEMRVRRHGFYIRNGCVDTGVTLIS